MNSDETLARTIAVTTHGRYVVQRPSTEERTPLLVAFHGYGQNADEFLTTLRRIPGTEQWTLVSVQGLHRFYNSKTEQVVASWMTRQDRELAIEDNISYVRSVVAEVTREFGEPSSLVYAGFSQGVAMAWRAAAFGGLGCDGILLLAGDVPPEIAAQSLAGFPPVLLGRGSHDQLYPLATFERDLECLATKRVRVETSVFDGGHEWTGEFSTHAGHFLQRIMNERTPATT